MTRAAASGLPQAGRSLAEMDKFIPIGQRQQGTEIASSLAAAESAANAGQDRAEMVVASPVPEPATPARPASVPPAATRPASPPAPVRPATVPSPIPASGAGGWRVQLGAFGTPAGAQAAWASLSATPGLAGLRPQLTRVGAMVRLQAGPLTDRASAVRACAAVVRAGKGCFPVAP
jgi:cell division septation protein DedD